MGGSTHGEHQFTSTLTKDFAVLEQRLLLPRLIKTTQCSRSALTEDGQKQT